jgi:hypothetical protein
MMCDKPVAILNVASVLLSFRSSCSPHLQLIPSILSATVPSKFLATYNRGSRAADGAIPACQWPILVCLGVKSWSSYRFESESDQCALFVMNGSKIELVHKFRGTR